MTIVSADTSSGPYAAAAQTTFVVDFYSASATEIEVTLDGVVQAANLYTFTRDTDGTGSVVFTTAVTGSVVIYSKPDLLQPTGFSRFGAFYPDQINSPLDRLAAGTLYLADQVEALYPLGARDADALPGSYLAWDADGLPVLASGTGADAGLRTDLAADTGARLVGTRTGQSVQAALDALGSGAKCLIVPLVGQSLTIGRTPQITGAAFIADNLYMPVGGPEWPDVTAPAPLDASSRPIVPTNLANFVPFAPIASKEGLAPGMAYQLREAGYSTVVAFSTGQGGSSISQHLAGGGTLGGSTGPYFANYQAFVWHAVKWALARGLEPVIAPVFIQGHADADLFVDGGLAGTETSQANYLAALTKLYRDVRLANSMALGAPWTGTLWLTPLLTGAASTPITLTGRKQVVAAQLQAATGGVPGIRLLPPHSQFAATFSEGDLVHPAGQGYRYYGEVVGAMIAQGTRTIPYITAKSVTSGTQVTVTFSEPVEISSLVIEATTAGVKAGLEAYTAGGTQIPLTAAAAGSATNQIVVTMASTATFSKIRNGLAQETTGAATLMPRTRIASPTALTTAEDGTALGLFSIPQEI